MATYTKVKLSASDDGLGIPIAVMGGAPNLTKTDVHQPPDGTASLDEVWIWATNYSTSDKELTIYFGGLTGSSANAAFSTVQTISSKSGLKLVIPGIVVQDEHLIEAVVNTDDTAVVLYGYVNRIT